MPSDVETPENSKRDEILSMRELTAELRLMRAEISRFNLFIASISQKAGAAGVVQSLIQTFLSAKSGKK